MKVFDIFPLEINHYKRPIGGLNVSGRGAKNSKITTEKFPCTRMLGQCVQHQTLVIPNHNPNSYLKLVLGQIDTFN